jgi:four helix bundle protein
MSHNFRELNIWKIGMDVVEEVYFLTATISNDERFNFKSQMQRSALSIPSNIAEGSGRTTDKDFVRFIDMSISSSYELETQLILVNRIFKIEVDSLIKSIHEFQRMTIGFKKTLQKKTSLKSIINSIFSIIKI